MKVRLIKGLSYATPSGSYKKGKTADVSEKAGTKLLKTGRFEEVKEEEAPGVEKVIAPAAENTDGAGNSGSNNNENGGEFSAEAIDKMKKDELVALADEKEIDISECNNNEERAEKIKGALGLVNMAQLFGE